MEKEKAEIQKRNAETKEYNAKIKECNAEIKMTKTMICLLIDRGAKLDNEAENHLKSDQVFLKIVKQKQDNIEKIKRNSGKKEPSDTASSSSVSTGATETKEKITPTDNKKEQNDKQSNSGISEKVIKTFFKSIEEGNLKQIEGLLKETLELINKIKNGRTPLVVALASKKPDAAELLLKNDEIDLTHNDTDGYTALMYAAKNKYPEIVKSILKKSKKPLDNILKSNRDAKNSLELAMFKPNNFAKLRIKQKSKILKNREETMELLLEYLSPEKRLQRCFLQSKIIFGIWLR